MDRAESAVREGSPTAGAPAGPTGPIGQLRRQIPRFDRRPFAVTLPGGGSSEINRNYDVIVRLPGSGQPQEIPVGIVSRSYQLVQQYEVLDLAVKALEAAQIDLANVSAAIQQIGYGEQAAFYFDLPRGPDREFIIGDDDLMSLRLFCFNSVDGSSSFKANLQWFRLICSNGMRVGQEVDMRRIHNRSLAVEEISEVLQRGLKLVNNDRILFDRWFETPVRYGALQEWADGPLREAWGVRAATRAYHIACTGHDVEFARPFEKAQPTVRSVTRGQAVPGAFMPATDVFAVSQVLSWLASERAGVLDQVAWMGQIPDLIGELVSLN